MSWREVIVIHKTLRGIGWESLLVDRGSPVIATNSYPMGGSSTLEKGYGVTSNPPGATEFCWRLTQINAPCGSLPARVPTAGVI